MSTGPARFSGMRKIGVSLGALGLACAALGAAVAPSSAAPRAKDTIVVVGQNDPAVDRAAIQLGLARAAHLGATRLVLRGTFDLGDCSLCVIVSNSITITGVGDPSVANPKGSGFTKIHTTGAAPFVILDSEDTDAITLNHLWIDGASTLAVMLLHVQGTFTMTDSRITNVVPGKEFRFAIAAAQMGSQPAGSTSKLKQLLAAAGEDPDAPAFTGKVLLDGNYIDQNLPMRAGDDNAFATVGCHFSAITITNNYLRAGEAVEIEGCHGTDATYTISKNVIVQTPTPSNLAQFTSSPGFRRNGGHPAAIKPVNIEAKSVIITDNRIDIRRGWASGSCIMTGNSNESSSTLIQGNVCAMHGQFAAILGGWAGTPGFFGPFYMRNTTIGQNVFKGTALLGLALLDFTFLNQASMAEVNKGHNNVMYDNSFKQFIASRAIVYLGSSTYDNRLAVGDIGAIVNLGKGNKVTRTS